jgi:phospholipase C
MPGRAPARFALLALLAGCTAGSSATGGRLGGLMPVARPASGNPVGSHIKHVVIIIQENRSFENFFAGYPGADAPMSGKTGATTIPLHEITFDAPDLKHDWRSSMLDWDQGKMDGFGRFGRTTDNREYAAYAYVRRSLIAPYWTIARRYVLADHMFPTEFGGSFTAHLTLVAGTDSLTAEKAEVNYPSAQPYDCDSPPGTTSSTVNRERQLSRSGPFPCFDQFNTIAQTLDDAGVPWKYYATKRLDAGQWEPFEAIKYVRYGSDWSNDIIAPQTKVLSDAREGKLASVTWISPSRDDSDHAGANHPSLGPAWVTSVVNAVGESPYWKSTAIVVLWDDWGGWYDNLPPPQLDFRGLGIRVPCLIISPYAKRGYVSHTRYEFGSILKFIEEAFNLPALGPASAGYTDTRANSLVDSFDFTQAPRKYKLIAIPWFDAARIRSEPPSDEPVDTE